MTTQDSSDGGFKSSRGATFGTLEQVFDDVWWAWGTTRFMPGTLFPRNMVIVREGGELTVVHPVMMPEGVQQKIEALGPIKHIVRLGAFHGMDDAAYVERYAPVVWGPPGLSPREGVPSVRDLVQGADFPLSGATIFSFERSQKAERALHLTRHEGLLLTCDSVQNWETTAGCSFLGSVMARAMGFRGRACIGPGWRRICEPKDGRGFAPDFERLMALEFKHAIGGHGPPMRDTAREDLRAQIAKVYAKKTA